MKFKIAQNSLFAILLRSRWWISFLVAFALAGAVRLAFSSLHPLFGLVVALPFIVVGCMAAWRQWKAPPAAGLAAALESAGAMSWRDFSAALERAYTAEGHTVRRLDGPVAAAADFELDKGGRTMLVCGKRWKAASNGIAPLRELHEAGQAMESRENVFITLGTLTDTARRYAEQHRIRIVDGDALARLLYAGKSAAK